MKRINIKKAKTFLCMCLCSVLVFVSGCGKTIDLTEEENYLIAEYAAELLIKYDRNIDLKYYSDNVTYTTTEEATTEELPVDDTEVTTTEDVTEEAEATETASDSESDSDESTTEKKDDSATGNVVTADGTPEEDVSAGDISSNVRDNSFDIASFAGVDTVSIKYSYYMLLDQYPSLDHEGVAITIDAPSGYKLLVVKFNMENKTGDDQYVDMFGKELEYSIIVDGNKKAKQMLTILIDDLYTYQGTVDGNMFEEVVLLFQVSDKVAESMSSLKLQVTDKNNNDVVIDLE